MGVAIKLTDRELPASPAFIDFLAHWLDARSYESAPWADQRSERLNRDQPELQRRAAQVAPRVMNDPRGRAQVEAVLQAICDYYGLSLQVLLGKSREMTVAQARQVAMYLLREDAGLTATQVGHELGRDHSTVLHGHARIGAALGGGDAIMDMVLDSIRKSVLQHGRLDTA